jgi:hypothetical protein
MVAFVDGKEGEKKSYRFNERSDIQRLPVKSDRGLDVADVDACFEDVN